MFLSFEHFHTLSVLKYKMLVFRAGIHKMFVGIAKQERPRSDCFFRSSLIWICPVCLAFLGRQLLFEILEHLPTVLKHKPVHFHVQSNTFTASKVVCFVICCCIFLNTLANSMYHTFRIHKLFVFV